MENSVRVRDAALMALAANGERESGNARNSRILARLSDDGELDGYGVGRKFEG